MAAFSPPRMLPIFYLYQNRDFNGSVENYWGLWLCIVTESSMELKKQKHKKQPWSNVECFAFGGATVRFASLETSFHAANHTIPPPPSYEGYPLCPKDKNRSPFHGEKPLMIKWFLGKKPHQIFQNRFCMVRTRYFASASNDWYPM